MTEGTDASLGPFIEMEPLTAADFPYEVWQCLQCRRFVPMTIAAVPGAYPEDGEVFCCEACVRRYYDQADD